MWGFLAAFAPHAGALVPLETFIDLDGCGWSREGSKSNLWALLTLRDVFNYAFYHLVFWLFVFRSVSTCSTGRDKNPVGQSVLSKSSSKGRKGRVTHPRRSVAA